MIFLIILLLQSPVQGDCASRKYKRATQELSAPLGLGISFQGLRVSTEMLAGLEGILTQAGQVEASQQNRPKPGAESRIGGSFSLLKGEPGAEKSVPLSRRFYHAYRRADSGGISCVHVGQTVVGPVTPAKPPGRD